MNEMPNELRRRSELGDQRRSHALFTRALEQGASKIHEAIHQIDDNSMGNDYAMHCLFCHSLSLTFGAHFFSP